jgi:hypothetical protein
MSTTEIAPISDQATIAAAPIQELTDLHMVCLFAVIGLALTGALVAFGVVPDIALST